MKISELQFTAQNRFSSVTKDDVMRIIAFVLRIPRLELYEHMERVLTKSEQSAIDAMFAERNAAKPLQYIFKEAPFRDLMLYVGEGVLIPRPETEMLVDLAKTRVLSPDSFICDLGTGSGAIALSLAQELPESSIIGVDFSHKALGYAERNKVRNKISNVEFLFGNLFSPFRKSLASCEGDPKRFALITANLPYVSQVFYDALPREVRDYEPEMALVSGEDGLDLIRIASEQAPAHLLPGGTIIFEHSPEQTKAICAILAENALVDVETVRDLTDRERFTLAVKPR
jgi:release factor glutamine methyltransferase